MWTIGYGHTETAREGMRIAQAQAEAQLRADLEAFEKAVNGLVTVRLEQHQFDALVSLAFNIGVGAFRRSTARRRLNAGDRYGAAEAMKWWNKATVNGVLREVRGLTRRRRAEAAMFLGRDGDQCAPFDLAGGVVDAPGHSGF